MDLNSKMRLKPGFQLTAESFNKIIDIFYSLQQTAVSTVLGGKIGLLPGHENSVKGAFVRDMFEIEIKDFVALLPSGKMLHINETAAVKVPLLYGEVYYLTTYVNDDEVDFESEGIPFVRNTYGFSIQTFEEMVETCRFPMFRFVVRDGVFSVDDSFMMPCLSVDDKPRFEDLMNRIEEALSLLSNHPNLQKNDSQTFLNYVFKLRTFRMNQSMIDVYSSGIELANAIDSFIMRQYADEAEEVMEFSPYDPERWFSWLVGYIERAGHVLDGVVIEEEKIDLDAIKQELRAEIYEHIQPELEKMVNERVDSLSDALQTRIEDVLKDYVSGKIRGELHDALRIELDADIRASLYSDLYQALYSVLFVPKEEKEDDFIPLM